MARSKKPTELDSPSTVAPEVISEEAMGENPVPSPEVTPAPQATRLKAIANLKRMNGHVRAGTEFTTDSSESVWLLANGYAAVVED